MYKFLISLSICIFLFGCSREMDYREYNKQVKICKDNGMSVFVKKGKSQTDFSQEIVTSVKCKDNNGIFWNPKNVVKSK